MSVEYGYRTGLYEPGQEGADAAGPVRAEHGPLDPASPAFEALLDAVAEGAAARDRERVHPFGPLDRVRTARVGALRLAPDEGGLGLSNRALFDVVIRLGAADSNVAHILRNHFAFVERFILVPERSAAQLRWLRAVADGAVFRLASGEADTKTVGAVVENTVLTSDGCGFRLNGTKFYSTGTLYADYVQVRAKISHDQLASAIVPIRRAGVELVDDWDGFGQRVTGSGTTILRDVRVEPDEVVADREGAFQRAPYSNTVSQLILTAISAGITRAAVRDASALLRGRERNFYYATTERPADDPVLLQTVGTLANHAFAARAVVLAAADALDRLDALRRAGEPDETVAHETALAAAQAKLVVDDLAIRSGSALLDVGGASASSRERNLDRHWRNARTLASHNPGPLKAQAVGDFVVNNTRLPPRGFF